MTRPANVVPQWLALRGLGLLRWVVDWWAVVHVGAQMLVLALSPSSYRRTQHSVLQNHLVAATAPLLPAFVAICANRRRRRDTAGGARFIG